MSVFGSSLLGFLLAVAILVTVHEMGHYLAARWCRVMVIRFSVGFGPVLLKWTGKRSIFAGTEFAISAIPLGGYVRMLDTRDPDSIEGKHADTSVAFNKQSLWKRSVIVAAGPLANFVLAAFLYTLALSVPDRDLTAFVAQPEPNTPAAIAGLHGGEHILRINDRAVAHWGDVRWALLTSLFDNELAIDVEERGVERSLILSRGESPVAMADSVGSRLSGWGLVFDQPAIIGMVKENGPAATAGLKPGDQIVAVDGQPIRQWTQLTKVIQAAPGGQVKLGVSRQGTTQEIVVNPRAELVAKVSVGRIDVGAISPLKLGDSWLTDRQRSITEAIVAAVQRTYDASALTVRLLWGMLTGDISLRQISGPLTMAEGAGSTLSQGAVAFTLFLAIVSISIGVLNLLPVPMLDGGQLLYHLFEALKGAPLSERAEAFGQRVGIGFVTALTALALYNDFLRIIS
jgi:regulator of sigma E protease